MTWNKHVILPEWLDTLIFSTLNGKYCRENSDMTVIDWSPHKILNYLGTYFPRSYTESYCIWFNILHNTELFSSQKSLSVLDFGCGTGGEIIGFARAISECRHNIDTITVKAIDGNQFALNRFDDIKDAFNKRSILKILCSPSAIRIDDFYDLSILDCILEGKFDVAMSFKAVCEFVTKQQFEEKNAYEHLANFMLPKVEKGGVMLLADITSRNDVANEWLPDMLDRGLKSAGAKVIARNVGNNETYYVTHSMQVDDQSKIAWRLVDVSC